MRQAVQSHCASQKMLASYDDVKRSLIYPYPKSLFESRIALRIEPS